jgi:hypothetical protein
MLKTKIWFDNAQEVFSLLQGGETDKALIRSAEVEKLALQLNPEKPYLQQVWAWRGS